jgi:predicted SnoaL-like aldol condensation-catalyzing enzyme
MTPSSADDDLVARVRGMFEEVMNRRRPEALADYVADDLIDHTPGPDQGPGLAGLASMVNLMLNASPSLRVVVDDVIVQGDRVAVRETWHTVRGIQQIAHFFRFAGGLIVEEWSMGWDDPARADEG